MVTFGAPRLVCDIELNLAGCLGANMVVFYGAEDLPKDLVGAVTEVFDMRIRLGLDLLVAGTRDKDKVFEPLKCVPDSKGSNDDEVFTRTIRGREAKEVRLLW